MTTYTQPTPEEDEAFSAIEKQQNQRTRTHGEAWLWLPEGEYTESQLRGIIANFERMREQHRIAHGILGGGH